MSVIYKSGDLLESTEKYIVHQTNVSSKGASGIAKAIFTKYPYSNVYKTRVSYSTPGEIQICGDVSKNERLVINLFGQYHPGPGESIIGDPDHFFVREAYFLSGLRKIMEIDNIESIAFPDHIGCGLAGGDWDHYKDMIEFFDFKINKIQNVQTIVYKKEE